MKHSGIGRRDTFGNRGGLKEIAVYRAGEDRVPLRLCQIMYAGTPVMTIPIPIAERMGWVKIVFATRAVAAKMKISGVSGYSGTL
jgi:hypothetical protein